MTAGRVDVIPFDDDGAEFAKIAITHERQSAIAQGDSNGCGRFGGEHDVVGHAGESNGDIKFAFDGLIAALQEPKDGGEKQKKQKREELPVPQT